MIWREGNRLAINAVMLLDKTLEPYCRSGAIQIDVVTALRAP
jgi:hypothetical protein